MKTDPVRDDNQPGHNSVRAQQRPRSRNWLMIAIVAMGAYGSYVASQYYRINDLNQRELANAAVEIKRAVDNAVGTVDQFTKSNCAVVRLSTAPSATAPLLTIPLLTDHALCAFNEDQPYLSLDGDCLNWQKAMKSVCDAEPRPGTTLDAEAELALELRPSTDKDHGAAFRFRFETDVIVRELGFPDLFDLVFVANTKGAVIYQDPPRPRRWSRYLPWRDVAFRDTGAGRPGGLRIQNLAQVIGGKEVSAWESLSALSARTTVDIAGSSHLLYLQPITFDDASGANVVVGALVSWDAVLRQALAVDTYFAAGLVLLVSLGLLGFPFVKLATLHPQERFTRRDLAALSFSTAALIVLLTATSLSVDAYRRWRHEANDGLRTLASRVHALFIEEVVALRDQVIRYDRQVAAWGPRACDTWATKTGWFSVWPEAAEKGALKKATSSPNPEDGDTAAAGLPPSSRLRFDLVAWAGSDGRQIWKQTADPVASKVVVDHRPYFKAVMDGGLVRAPGTETPFFVSPDRSFTDGRVYTFIALRSTLAANYCTKVTVPPVESYMVTATAQLLSMDHPPLPAGYGFAIINREGRVLYHSDARVALRENFFDAASDGRRIRAMVYSGYKGHVGSRYRERPHQLYIEPIADLQQADGAASPSGLHVVTFRDTSVEQAVVARAFIGGLTGPVLLFFAVAAATLWLAARIMRRDRRAWTLWLCPRTELDSPCKVVSLRLAAIFAIAVVLRVVTDSDLWLLFLPAVAIATVTATATHWAPGATKPLTGRMAKLPWHTIAVVMLLVLVVMMPTGVVLRIVLGHEFAKMIRTEQRWIETQRETVLSELRSDLRTQKYAPEFGKAFTEARASYWLDPPRPFDQEPAPLSSGSPLILGVFDGLDELLPIGNDEASRQFYQDEVGSFSPPGAWPILRASNTAIVGLFATVAFAFLWVRWGTSNFLLASAKPGEAQKVTAEEFESVWKELEDRRFVLLQVAHEHVANPYQHEAVQEMLARGLLIRNPDLQPMPSLKSAIEAKEREKDVVTALREWELAGIGTHTHRMRMFFLSGLGIVALYLLTTQPGLQSAIVGIAVALTGLLQTAAKLRDAAVSWFEQRRA